MNNTIALGGCFRITEGIVHCGSQEELNGELLFGCEIAYSSWSHARKYDRELELSELVNQWREVWRVRSLTRRQALIHGDGSCASCPADREDMSSMSRVVHRSTKSVVCKFFQPAKGTVHLGSLNYRRGV